MTVIPDSEGEVGTVILNLDSGVTDNGSDSDTDTDTGSDTGSDGSTQSLGSIDGQEITEVDGLGGRGQEYPAFFVGVDKTDIRSLVKTDNLGTILQEAFAIAFLDGVVFPDSSQTASIVDFIYKGSPKIATKQDEVSGQDIPRFLFGARRKPKDYLDMGYRYRSSLKQYLDSLPLSSQFTYAAGLFHSVLAGDESTHIGQFMVKDEKDHPPRFVKIDFGAACRHAVARDVKTRLDPYTTSRFYTRFNIYKMFGKNYITHQLKNKSIRNKFTLLCLQQNDQNKENISINIAKVINAISDNAKKMEAQAEFTIELYKSSSNKNIKELKKILRNNSNDRTSEIEGLLKKVYEVQDPDVDITKIISEKVALLHQSRIEKTKEKAESELDKILNIPYFNDSDATRIELKEILKKREHSVDEEEKLKEIFEELKDLNDLKKNKRVIRCLDIILDALVLSGPRKDTKNKDIKKEDTCDEKYRELITENKTIRSYERDKLNKQIVRIYKSIAKVSRLSPDTKDSFSEYNASLKDGAKKEEVVDTFLNKLIEELEEKQKNKKLSRKNSRNLKYLKNLKTRLKPVVKTPAASEGLSDTRKLTSSDQLPLPRQTSPRDQQEINKTSTRDLHNS